MYKNIRKEKMRILQRGLQIWNPGLKLRESAIIAQTMSLHLTEIFKEIKMRKITKIIFGVKELEFSDRV